MSNLTSNLKQWGAQGAEYPDGYSYASGKRPVDAWDNYFAYWATEEIHTLQSLANDRLESDAQSAEPSNPEPGHQWYDPDDGKYRYYDSVNTTFRPLLRSDGDSMTGALDMNGYSVKSSTGTVNVAGTLSTPDTFKAEGANLRDSWLSKQEGGTIAAGAFVPIGTFGLDAGETLEVTQAMLTKDGFDTPASSGLNLTLAASNGDFTVILSGDGATLYDDETGNPHTSWENVTGGHVTVAIGLDNGNYNAGVGNDVGAYGGFIARVV